MKKNLASHVFVNEANITDELVLEMNELALMKRPIYLQPSFMLGHLDPYKSNIDVENVLKSIDEKQIPVNLVLGSKIYEKQFEDLRKMSEKMQMCKLTPMQGALWS